MTGDDDEAPIIGRASIGSFRGGLAEGAAAAPAEGVKTWLEGSGCRRMAV